jgi:hypothetical protein
MLFLGKVIVDHAASYTYRVTRWVSGKVAQNVSQQNFCRNYYITFTVEKSSPNICDTYVIFQKEQSKQSPNRRKFAQSGHPAPEQKKSYRWKIFFSQCPWVPDVRYFKQPLGSKLWPLWVKTLFAPLFFFKENVFTPRDEPRVNFNPLGPCLPLGANSCG